MFIIDLFKFFAKFPTHASVLANFKNSNANIPGYDTIKTYVTDMVEKELISDLKHFVYGFDDDQILDQLRTVTSHFLHVEYGQISLEKNQYENFNNQISLKIIVAKPYSKKNKDSIEESLIQEASLNILYSIIKNINDSDDDRCSFKKYLSYPVRIVPVDPKAYYQNIGWMALFNSVDNTL